MNRFIHWGAYSTAVLAALFKNMHWQGADVLLLLAMLWLVITALFSFRTNKQQGLKNTPNVLLLVFLIILIMSIGLRAFNLPGGALFAEAGYLILLLLPAWILITNRDNKVSYSFWVVILLIFFLFASLVRLKVRSMDAKLTTINEKELVD